MKQIIQKIGDKLIQVIAGLVYTILLVMAFSSRNFEVTLLILVGGGIVATLFFYLLFALLDMRDSLRDIRDSLKK